MSPALFSPQPSDEAIRATLASGKLEEIEDLFDALWYELPDRFAPEVAAATRALDPAVLARRPRVLHCALLAHHRASHGPGDAELRKLLHAYTVHGRAYAANLSSFTRPADLATAGTIAVISARLRGAYEDSERIGSWVDQRLTLRAGSHALPWAPAHVAAKPGWLSTQRGLTATLVGRLDRAVHLYSRAHAEAGPAPSAHFAGANAVANLALLSAYRGHLDLARSWLGTLDDVGPLPGWIEHLTTVGAKIARALIAIEEADAAEADRHLDLVGSATQNLELWPFIAYAHAAQAALFGDPHAGLARLDEARTLHGALDPDPGTLVGELLLRSEAKLLVRAEAGNRVLNLAHENPAAESLAQHVAWVHLLAGHHHQAVRTAARALQQVHLPIPDMMSLQVVLAVAHLRAGNRDRAAAAFRTAVQLRSTPSHVRPFLSADARDVAELAGLAGVANPLSERRLHVRVNVPRDVQVVHLTRREQAVLDALGAGDTAEQAAERFGVAPTTVRSQIRSIYRKLGVSRRDAALARAQELGLLHARRGR